MEELTAEILNSYFTNVFKDARNTPTELSPIDKNYKICTRSHAIPNTISYPSNKRTFCTKTTSDILDATKSTGLDELGPKFLKPYQYLLHTFSTKVYQTVNSLHYLNN